jgi:hypothetical protein
MSMSDVVTQTALRKLADECTAQAEEIESKENKAAKKTARARLARPRGALELGRPNVPASSPRRMTTLR